MIKLLVVIPSFYPATIYGGPIFSSLYVSKELAKNNVLVNVSTTNANGKSKLETETNISLKFADNFYVKYYNETFIGRFSFAFFFNIWKDIRKSEIVHIQAIFSIPTPIALFYSFLFRKPIILSPRGALGEWCLQYKKSKFKSFWLKFLILPYKSKITWHATSEQEKNEILSVDKNAKVFIIPNGFEPGIRYMPSSKNNNPAKKVIISMGRIHEKKGFDILIKAFAQVLVKYPESELKIAGKDDGEKTALTNLSIELGLRKHVSFIEHIEGDKKNEFLSDADVFVLPSHNENFGNVYAEALAAGTPIVSSINTPWEEVVQAGCGCWVSNTVEDTTNAMLDLLSRNREELRQNALKYVQKYDWENIAIQFKKLYEETLKS